LKNIDETDVKILKNLLKDGRKSFMDIAQEYHLSKDIIWKHYNDMKKAGTIVGATIQYNYLGFGYDGVATIMVNVESQFLTQTLERLTKIPNVLSFRLYNLEYNIAVVTTIINLKDLENIKGALKRQNPITASKTYGQT